MFRARINKLRGLSQKMFRADESAAGGSEYAAAEYDPDRDGYDTSACEGCCFDGIIFFGE